MQYHFELFYTVFRSVKLNPSELKKINVYSVLIIQPIC